MLKILEIFLITFFIIPMASADTLVQKINETTFQIKSDPSQITFFRYHEATDSEPAYYDLKKTDKISASRVTIGLHIFPLELTSEDETTGPINIYRLQDRATGALYYSVRAKSESRFTYFHENYDEMISPAEDQEIAKITIAPGNSTVTYFMYTKRNRPLGKMIVSRDYMGHWQILAKDNDPAVSRIFIALTTGLDQIDHLLGITSPPSYWTRAAIGFGSFLFFRAIYNWAAPTGT